MSVKTVTLVCACGYKRRMTSGRMFSKSAPKCTRCGNVLNEMTRESKKKRCVEHKKKSGRPKKTALPKNASARCQWQRTDCRACGKRLNKMNQHSGLCFSCQGYI